MKLGIRHINIFFGGIDHEDQQDHDDQDHHPRPGGARQSGEELRLPGRDRRAADVRPHGADEDGSWHDHEGLDRTPRGARDLEAGRGGEGRGKAPQRPRRHLRWQVPPVGAL